MSAATSSAFNISKANCPSLNAARCAIWTSLLVVAAAALLAPIAWRQLSTAGLLVVGASTAVLLMAILQSQMIERYFTRAENIVAAVLAPMVARMLMPVAFVLAIVAWNHPSVPAWSAIYIAPLYLVMLSAETLFAVRRRRIALIASRPAPAATSLVENQG